MTIRQNPLIYAHRGAHNGVIENTVQAFQAASRIGAAGIETDVQLDRLKRPIILHDRVLPDGRPVSNFSQQELTELLGYRVPELSEALESAADICWDIELKTLDAVGPATEILRDFVGRIDFFVSSFIHQAVEQVVKSLDIKGALLVAHCPIGPLLDLSNLDPRIFGIVWDCAALDDRALAWARRANLENIVYGFANLAEQRRFLKGEVSIIITDFLDSAGSESFLMGEGNG